ncbi:Adenosylmethionine-8-amino-7-oxononanoate aminotransferase [Streptomyces tendae]
MCLQYWRSLGRPGKRRLLTWRGGYHGDTWQPMSVCDPEAECTSCGRRPAAPGLRGRPAVGVRGGVRRPPAVADRAARRRSGRGDRRAGGAGRGRDALPLPRAPLRVLREACDAQGVLLVFDEIATGLRARTRLVRGGARGGDAGRDVCGQGADRRLSDDGGHAVHGAGWPRASRGARCRCWPTGPRSWAIRWRRPWRARRSGCCSARTGARRSSGSRRAWPRGSRPPPSCPVCATYGRSVRSAWCSSTTPSTCGRRRRRRCARACGCARSAIWSTDAA